MFAGQLKHLNRGRKRIAALEQDFIEQIVCRAPLTNVIHVQIKLLLQRFDFPGCFGVPWLKVGFRELEDFEAAILRFSTFQIEFATVFLVELLDDATYALLANVDDGLEACFVGGTVRGTGLRNLDENELPVATILFVQIKNGVCNSP